MDDIEALCSRVMLINHGRILSDGTLDDLRLRVTAERWLIVDLENETQPIADDDATVVKREGPRVTLAFDPRKVAAHAHGTQGIKDAVRAGVDSIEHGSLIDAEGIEMMKAHGTYLVADIYNDDYILGKAIEFGLPKENVDKEKMVGRLQRENFSKAVAAGVKIAFGTDAGVYPHGDNAKQFHYMVKFGMTPAGAIRAATSSAADLIDRANDVGTLEAGKYADLIAVTANPLERVEVLEHVSFVMKGGKVYKDELGAAKP